MSTKTHSAAMNSVDARLLLRILDEGYGPGAWHGPNLKETLADVSAELALWRPSPGRHNIAEIALHHAYYVNSVKGRISKEADTPFVLDGEDWFEVPDESRLPWARIQEILAGEQALLLALIESLQAGTAKPDVDADEITKLILGITCHAVYHAGQVQLLKRLAEN